MIISKEVFILITTNIYFLKIIESEWKKFKKFAKNNKLEYSHWN
jgi:hypothetical protein